MLRKHLHNIYYPLKRLHCNKKTEGHEVIAAQNSLDTLKGDVAVVHKALGRVSSPAILVGHSYGGTRLTMIQREAKRLRRQC